MPTPNTSPYEVEDSTPSPLALQIKSAFLEFLARKQENAAVREVSQFWKGNPDVGFLVFPENKFLKNLARYDHNRRAIILYRNLFDEVGVESDINQLPPNRLSILIETIAPTLIHESIHAQTHQILGLIPQGAVEEEILASAYHSWFVAQEELWATPENYGLAGRWFDECTPLLVENRLGQDQWLKTVTRWYAARKAEDHSAMRQINEDFERLKLTKERLQREEAELKRRLGTALNPYQRRVLSDWVAFSRGWDVLAKKIHDVEGGTSVFTAQEAIDQYKAELYQTGKQIWDRYVDTQDSSGKKQDLANWQLHQQALRWWGDPQNIKSARDYYQRRFASLQPYSGRGYQKAGAIRSAAQLAEQPFFSPMRRPQFLWFTISIMTVTTLSLWGIRKFFKPQSTGDAVMADPEMAAYIQKYAALYGTKMLREHLLSEGHPPARIDAAIRKANVN